jgi:hypothetical protein
MHKLGVGKLPTLPLPRMVNEFPGIRAYAWVVYEV